MHLTNSILSAFNKFKVLQIIVLVFFMLLTQGALTAEASSTEKTDISRLALGALAGSNDTECVAPPSGMVAWWTLGEKAGPMSADIALHPNDGTHIKNPTPTIGLVDGALSFNGSNYIEVPSHDEINLGTDDLSIEAWIKTTKSSGVQTVVAKRHANRARNTQGYSLHINNGKLSFQLADGDGTATCSNDPDASSCTDYSSGVSVADGEWHLVTVTVDRDDPEGGRFYVDGEVVSTFNPTIRSGSLDNDNPLRIASRSAFKTGLFHGEIDEVQLFKRVLTEEEIKSIYEEGSAGQCKVDTGEVTDIYVTPADGTILASESYTVEIRVDNIEDFYANQLEISYDPAIVEVVDAYDFLAGIQIHHGGFLAQDTVIKNIVDNGSGIIQYSTSFQENKPGISGSGVLARIVFRGLISGTSPISLDNVILSDPQSVAIQATKGDGQIVVQEPDSSSLRGQVILERRGDNNNSGAEVCVGAVCATTIDDGSYILNDVPVTGNVEVHRQSYLSSTYAYSSTGGLITLPDVTLLGGDINQDGFINIDDGVLVGMAWNSTPADAHWDIRADVTDDGNVDILDMVAVQFNWNETAPGPWAVVQAAGRKSARSVVRAATVEGVFATDAEAQVAITPTFSAVSKLNDSTKFDIMAENVTDLYAFTIVTSFDPDKVQVVDANPMEEGVQIRIGDLLDPFNQFVLFNQVDNENGTLELSVTQTHPAEAKSGSGSLGTITFETVGVADTAIVLTSATRLVDNSTPDPQAIAATIQGSTLRSGLRIYLPMMIR